MAARQDRSPDSTPAVHAGDPLDLAESVAGEEDPGASIDLATVPAGQASRPTSAAHPPVRRSGDEVPEGTAGAGENICLRCGGCGQLGASACPECAGTGRVSVGRGRA